MWRRAICDLPAQIVHVIALVALIELNFLDATFHESSHAEALRERLQVHDLPGKNSARVNPTTSAAWSMSATTRRAWVLVSPSGSVPRTNNPRGCPDSPITQADLAYAS